MQGLDIIRANLLKWQAEKAAAALLAMQEVAVALAGWAKAEHGHPGGPQGVQPAMVLDGHRYNPPHAPPFWDLYGHTTNSITAGAEAVSADLIRAVLSAGMDYDVFLELARNGKWAFLWPTLINHQADIMKIIEKRLGAGAALSMTTQRNSVKPPGE